MNSPVLLTAHDIELHYGEHPLLDKVSFSIHQGEKVALVGRNGSGKTSLLKIVVGLDTPDGGWIEKRRDLTIGYLSQEFTLDLEKTVYENLMQGAKDLIDLIEEYEKLPAESERRHQLFEEIQAIDGWNLDQRINTLITSMNLHPRDTLIKDFSGGEKRRLAMAKALVSNPDLLILDEPTNHLDTENIEWLEKYLQKYRGACLFITHDRYFLDRIATRILELSHGHLFSHSGNYTDFIIRKAERAATEERQEHNRQRYLQKELAWIARSPQGRTTKSKGRIQRYEESANEVKHGPELDVEMIIPTPPQLSDRILDVKNVTYEIGGRTLFSGLNLNFQKGMRVGIIGKNGVGKSTLLKFIVGELQPTKGVVDKAGRTEINYADQEKLSLNPENTVIKELSDNIENVSIGGRTIPTRGYLKRFLFTDRQMSSLIKNLSGGERSRLILAKILKHGGNFLILDEPTNDLDLSTLRVLEEALIDFDGCAIIVSHDRYFLNRVCTHILGFEGNGKTRLLAGDYDLYKKVSDEYSPENVNTVNFVETKIPVRFDAQKQREIFRIEGQIQVAEKKVKNLEAQFFEPDFYVKYGDRIEQLSNELQKAKDKVDELYKKWEELQSDI